MANQTTSVIKAIGSNVGIGTTSPLSKLHIESNLSGSSLLKINGTYGTLFEVVDDLSDSLMGVSDVSGLPVFEVFADNHIVAGRYGQNDFYLDTTGNLGLGTSSPSSKLYIKAGSGGSFTPNTNHDDLIIETSGNGGIQLFSPASNYQYLAFGDPSAANAGYIRYSHADNNMVFRTNSSDRITLNSSGQVKFTNYGSGNNTGTSAQFLTIDSSGNLIEETFSSVATGGSGTTNYIAKWTGALVLGNSLIYDNNSGIGINTTTISTEANIGGALSFQPGGAAWNADNSRPQLKREANGELRISSGKDSASHITFHTNTTNLVSSTEKVRIQNDGNVGIGTTDPKAPLHVTDSGGTGIEFIPQDAYNRNIIFSYKRSTSAYKQLSFNANDFVFTTGGVNDRMVINSSGNVGIGTTSPSSIFTINQGSLPVISTVEAGSNLDTLTNTDAGILRFRGPYSNSYTPIGDIRVRTNASAFRTDIVLMPRSTGGSLVEGLVVHGTVSSGAFVGIGTGTPSNKLHVLAPDTDATPTALLQNSSTGDASLLFNVSGRSYTIGIDNSDDDKFKISRSGFGLGTDDRLTINGEGNVGLGTTSPTSLLHLRNPNADSDVGIKIGNDVRDWNLKVMGSVSDSFQIFTHDDSNVFTILSDGNVGIGTTSPDSPLQINSSDAQQIILSGATDPYIRFRTGSTNRAYIQWVESGTSFSFFNQAGDNFDFFTHDSGAINLRLKGSDGDIWGSVYATDNSGTHQVGILDGDQHWAAKHVKDTSWEFLTNNQSRMFINSTGVGIGTTSPSQALEVAGQYIKITGNNAGLMLNDTSSGSNFLVFSNADNLRMVVDGGSFPSAYFEMSTAGHVGLGTYADSTDRLTVAGNIHATSTVAGASVLTIDGTNGTLFEVVDDLSDSLMSVNDAAGLPVFEAFADNTVIAGRFNQNDFYLKGSSGNIGIGTSNPAYKLEVIGDIRSSGTVYADAFESITGGNSIEFNDNIYLTGSIQVTEDLRIGNSKKLYLYTSNDVNYLTYNKWEVNTSTALAINNAGTGGFQIQDSGTAVLFCGTDSTYGGRVGIGTTTPASTFHVNGQSFLIGANYGIYGNNDSTNYRLFDNSSGQLVYNWYGGHIWQTLGGTERMRITSAGELQVTGNGVIKNQESGGNYSYLQQTSSDARLFVQYSQPLLFGTAATERMRIESGGNVGIGTTSPENKLHVEGSVLINAGTGSGTFNDLNIGGVSGWSSPEAHRINFIYGNAASPNIFTTIESEYVGSSSKLHFRNMYNNASPQTGYVMSILGTGNVGIGTTGPTSLLHIDTGANSAANFRLGANRTVANAAVGQLIGDWNGTAVAKIAFKSGDDTTNKDDGEIAFEVASAGTTAEAMRIQNDGNIGIGTTSPSVKLEVKDSQDSSLNSGIGIIRSASSQTGYINMVGGAFNFNAPSAIPIKFRDGGTANMTILGDGNVGIGTESPGRHLSVTDLGQIKLTNNSTGNWAGLDLLTSGGTNNYTAYFGMLDSNGNFFIDVASNGDDVIIRQSGETHIGLQGNVGIGTTSNSAKLDVRGRQYMLYTGADNTILHMHNNSATGYGVYLRVDNSDVSRYALRIDNGTSQNFTVPNSGGLILANLTDNVDQVKITRAGYSTTHADAKLYIYDNSNSDWAQKISLDGYSYGLRIDGWVDYGLNIAHNTLGEILITRSSELVINESGNNYNFRVEGDTDQNLLVCDASEDAVAIGKATPVNWNSTKLDVNGSIYINGAALITSQGGANDNVDHLWHDDNAYDGTGGAWNFVSDGTYQQNGNSRLRAAHVYMDGTGDNYFAGSVGIGTTAPAYKLEVIGDVNVDGNVKHTGLTMTSGTDIDQLSTFSQTLTIGTSWGDTGISSSNLATGTYIVQLFVNDYSVGGGQYSLYYSGTMSWYGSGTNDADFGSEIILHRAGHADNNKYVYLRTLAQASGVLKLQIAGNYSASGSSTYTFKFRRMI